jgi:hypothetical protein
MSPRHRVLRAHDTRQHSEESWQYTSTGDAPGAGMPNDNALEDDKERLHLRAL